MIEVIDDTERTEESDTQRRSTSIRAIELQVDTESGGRDKRILKILDWYRMRKDITKIFIKEGQSLVKVNCGDTIREQEQANNNNTQITVRSLNDKQAKRASDIDFQRINAVMGNIDDPSVRLYFYANNHQ